MQIYVCIDHCGYYSSSLPAGKGIADTHRFLYTIVMVHIHTYIHLFIYM